jgi:hypothetical protein
MRAAAARSPSGAGVDDQPVETIVDGELAALVSDAPSVPVKASRRNLLAHSRVLREAAERSCILPMRFGVVMPDRATVREELLGPHATALAQQLEQLDGLAELDVRAMCAEDALLRAAVARHPQIKRMREALEGRPLEATYYERIQLGEHVAHAVAELRDAIAEQIVRELAPHAVAFEPGEPLHEHVLAQLAFLVERDRLDEFDAAVQRLGQELGSDVRLRYVGPLPPHSFVDLGAALEERAWA